MQMKDLSLVTELIDGVRQAVPSGGTEKNVVTYISRPMWAMWCIQLGMPPDSDPTEWSSGMTCNRVYGSLTIVVESDQFFAISRAIGGIQGYQGKIIGFSEEDF